MATQWRGRRLSACLYGVTHRKDGPVVSRFDVSKEIGRRLRDRRHELALTTSQLGALCDLAPSLLRDYEIGRPIPAARLWQLSRIIDVTPDYFFQRL
jgi:predicted transcriptional regulator